LKKGNIGLKELYSKYKYHNAKPDPHTKREYALQILAEPRSIDEKQGFCIERTQYDKGKDYKQQRQNNGGMA